MYSLILITMDLEDYFSQKMSQISLHGNTAITYALIGTSIFVGGCLAKNTLETQLLKTIDPRINPPSHNYQESQDALETPSSPKMIPTQTPTPQTQEKLRRLLRDGSPIKKPGKITQNMTYPATYTMTYIS